MTNSPAQLLTVTPRPEWSEISTPDLEFASNLWAISDEIRHGFAENLVESRGAISGAVAHHEVIAEFHEACASLPEWSQNGQRLWSERGASFALFTGTAAVGDERIESTSVIGVDTADGSLTAHQVVVTTFADNHDLHRDALQAIRTADTTIGSIWHAG